MAFTRREFSLAALAAAPLLMGAARASAASRCIPPLGIQTYSFRDMLQTPGDMVDKMIAGCKAVGLSMVELFEPTIQPPAFSLHAPWAFTGGKPTEASLYGRPPEGPPSAAVLETRERIREWRLSTHLSVFRDIGRRFRKAGITIQAFNFGLKEDCTDEEVERGFAMTRALGTQVMTASTTLKMCERAAPFAARHRTLVALHGHSNLRDPNQLATPQSFESALAMSPFYRLNLDIGHFSAAGFDTLAFIRQNHEKIVSVHLKDRKNNDGANMPFGEGDTPIVATAQLIRDHCYPIPIILEYEYAGADSITELKRIHRFVADALNAPAG